MGAVADVISSGVNLVGQIFGANKNYKSVVATNQANKELAEYSYSKDLEMWNRQNEYNNPKNQMQRLKDAGLNPNLAYGSGSVAGNTGSNMPHYNRPTMQAPRVEVPNILSNLSQYQDIRKKEADVNLTNEAIRAKKTENLFLGSMLQSKDKNLFLESVKNTNLFGQNFDNDYVNTAFQASPFMSKYQADITRQNLDNFSKKLDNSLKSKGINSSDSAFLRTIALNQAGYNTSSILPYVIGEQGFKTLSGLMPRIKLFQGKQKLNVSGYRR